MKISINVTIHNKAYLLPLFLKNLIKNTTGDYELVFVIDGCTDNSRDVVMEYAQDTEWVILDAPDVFEVKANNIAAKESHGDIIIIVQDDQIIQEYGWNEKLVKPFELWDDVFAVSGRMAHNWMVKEDSEDLTTDTPDLTRWCDVLQPVDMVQCMEDGVFYIRQYCNRGPLALRHDTLKKLGYLDEEFAPLIFDELDIQLKAKEKFGMISGCYPIGWMSKEEWGGTRDGEGKTKKWVYEVSYKNARLIYNRYGKMLKTPVIDKRYIN